MPFPKRGTYEYRLRRAKLHKRLGAAIARKYDPGSAAFRWWRQDLIYKWTVKIEKQSWIGW